MKKEKSKVEIKRTITWFGDFSNGEAERDELGVGNGGAILGQKEHNKHEIKEHKRPTQ
jgi:hypothetical protein